MPMPTNPTIDRGLSPCQPHHISLTPLLHLEVPKKIEDCCEALFMQLIKINAILKRPRLKILPHQC